MRSTTSISVLIHGADRVTQNARLRTFDRWAGNVTGWRDKSCAGTNTCATGDYVYVGSGQAASIQCNGVRAAGPTTNHATNVCRLERTLVV